LDSDGERDRDRVQDDCANEPAVGRIVRSLPAIRISATPVMPWTIAPGMTMRRSMNSPNAIAKGPF